MTLVMLLVVVFVNIKSCSVKTLAKMHLDSHELQSFQVYRSFIQINRYIRCLEMLLLHL